jgi:hypothetical protein
VTDGQTVKADSEGRQIVMNIDQSLMWKAMEERLARTTSPRHRQMLQAVIDHSKAEAAGDLDGVLATLSGNPSYHFWSDGHDVGPKGMTAVIEFYKRLVHSGAAYLESPKDRIVVDDDNVVTEMRVRQIVHGVVAKANGYQVEDEKAFYCIRFRAVILWPFTPEGKIDGEDSYVSRDLADITRLDDADVPQSLRDLVAASTVGAYVFT